MPLTPFPAIPQSSDPPDVFNASVDAFLAHLSTMVFEINTQVGLLSDANTWTAPQTFPGVRIQESIANIFFYGGGGGPDTNKVILQSAAGAFRVFALNDAETEVQEALSILRSGLSVSGIVLGNSTSSPDVAAFGNFVVSSSGKGLSFAAAGGDTLTMYDEGTFTPDVAGASYASRSGSYTRIGNRVFFELNLQMSAQGSSTDTITGLPFTAAAGTVSPVSVGIYTSIGASIVDVRGEVLAGTTSILIRGSNSAATGITLGTLIGSSAIIKVSGSYRV